MSYYYLLILLSINITSSKLFTRLILWVGHNFVAYSIFCHDTTILTFVKMKYLVVCIISMSKRNWFISIVNMVLISLVFANSITAPAKIYATDFSERSITTGSAISPINETNITITLERNMCKGTCPYYSLLIFWNGTIIYNGKEFVNVLGHQVSEIPPERVGELVKKFYKANYFSLEDLYDNIIITDQPTVNTSISINGKYKNILIIMEQLRLKNYVYWKTEYMKLPIQQNGPNYQPLNKKNKSFLINKLI